MNIRTLTLISFLCFSCNSPCDCYSENEFIHSKNKETLKFKISEINTDSLGAAVSMEKVNPLFTFHNDASDNNNFYFLSKKSNNIFSYNLENKNLQSIVSAKSIIGKNKLYSILLQGDTLHFLDVSKKKYLKCDIINQIPIPIDSINFSDFEGFKNYNINIMAGKPGLVYEWPYLWLQYGHWKKYNYIDSKAYLRINLNTKEFVKALDYPTCFHCCYQYLPTSSMVLIGNKRTACLFDYYDKIFISSAPYQYYDTSFLMNHECKMVNFNKKEENNLGYVRKYLENAETNLQLAFTNDMLIALKRNGKDKLTDKPTFSIFVFDEFLNEIFNQKLPFSLPEYPSIVSYKKGFLLFNESFKKAYYYEK